VHQRLVAHDGKRLVPMHNADPLLKSNSNSIYFFFTACISASWHMMENAWCPCTMLTRSRMQMLRKIGNELGEHQQELAERKSKKISWESTSKS